MLWWFFSLPGSCTFRAELLLCCLRTLVVNFAVWRFLAVGDSTDTKSRSLLFRKDALLADSSLLRASIKPGRGELVIEVLGGSDEERRLSVVEVLCGSEEERRLFGCCCCCWSSRGGAKF